MSLTSETISNVLGVRARDTRVSDENNSKYMTMTYLIMKKQATRVSDDDDMSITKKQANTLLRTTFLVCAGVWLCLIFAFFRRAISVHVDPQSLRGGVGRRDAKVRGISRHAHGKAKQNRSSNNGIASHRIEQGVCSKCLCCAAEVIKKYARNNSWINTTADVFAPKTSRSLTLPQDKESYSHREEYRLPLMHPVRLKLLYVAIAARTGCFSTTLIGLTAGLPYVSYPREWRGSSSLRALHALTKATARFDQALVDRSVPDGSFPLPELTLKRSSAVLNEAVAVIRNERAKRHGQPGRVFTTDEMVKNVAVTLLLLHLVSNDFP